MTWSKTPSGEKNCLLDSCEFIWIPANRMQKRIDYGFKGDENLRKKMGGELFFYGSQIPMKASSLEVGLEDGLIHKLVGKPNG